MWSDNLPQGLRSILSEVFSWRFVTLFVGSVFFLLISQYLEKDTMLAAYQAGNFDAVKHHADNKVINIIIGLTKEIGFAGLIALLLIIVVENASKKEQRKLYDEFVENVSDNVFRAILKRNVPKTIVDQTLDILSSDLVRKNMRMNIVLHDLPDEHVEMSHAAVRMSVTIDYDIENISSKEIESDVRLILPQTRFKKLRDLVSVECVSIDSIPLEDLEVEEGSNKSQGSRTEKVCEWPFSVKAGHTININAKYQLIKEVSDNEVWTNLLPSTETHVTVDMRLKDTEWDVDALHSGNLNPIQTSKNGPFLEQEIMFRTNEAILPFQGFSLWWRPRDPNDIESPCSDGNRRLTDDGKVLEF